MQVWKKGVVNQTDVRGSELKICVSLQDQASYHKEVLPLEIGVDFFFFTFSTRLFSLQ